MKSCLGLIMILVSSLIGNAQGLEKIILEKYYITDKSDHRKTGIPVKLVTYRVFVDMKPGYNLQSVYGSPGHALKIATTTYFYNDTAGGSYIPNLIEEKQLEKPSALLDTWISMGAGCQSQIAIMKSDDTVSSDTGLTGNLYRNKDERIGFPIQQRDGLYKTENLPPRVTQVGIDSLLSAFDKRNTVTGFEFITENGGWGCIGGARGVDPETNRVCIGQFTTDGDFYFEFNIQIGSPEYGVEQYVSQHPVEKEQLFPGLIVESGAGGKKQKPD